MVRMLKWALMCLLVISIALPLPAYACSPAPDHWEVTIGGLQYPDVELPDGIGIDVSRTHIEFLNRTEQSVTLSGLGGFGVKTIEAGRSLLIVESDIFHGLFPSEGLDNSAYYSAGRYAGDDIDEPPVTDEIRFLLTHDGERYIVPIMVLYDVAFVPTPSNACSFIYLWPEAAIAAVVIVVVGLAIYLIGTRTRKEAA